MKEVYQAFSFNFACYYLFQQIMFIIFIKMEMNLNELLEFCAYFQLNKLASKLTIQTFPQNKIRAASPSPQPAKNTRKKVEHVQPKKVEKTVKPKMQVVPKKVKKEPAPVQRQQYIEDGQDLNYFLSHMSGNIQQKSSYRPRERIDPYHASKPYSGTSNYQTFGKSRGNFDVETFESKMKKQNNFYDRGNYTERPYQTKNYITKSTLQTEPKNYMINESARNKNFWENTVYETRKNDKSDLGNLIYSPVRRETLSPSQSSIISEIRRDQELSKSRSKQKRKNSERPFYNASQLTPRDRERENETRVRKNEYDQSALSNSYISTQEVRVTNNKRAFDEESRRQTSTSFISKKDKTPIQREFQSQLDYGLEDIVSGLSAGQRNAPIAISIIPKTGKL